MDPNNISVTPGSNSNDNGGSSVHTSSCRHLMSFLPTGTQLATTDGRDSGSSSLSPSTASPDLESHSLHPEDTLLNQVWRLLLVSMALSPRRQQCARSSTTDETPPSSAWQQPLHFLRQQQIRHFIQRQACPTYLHLKCVVYTQNVH